MIDTPTLLAYFGHHRCGTQWMKSILRGVSRIAGREVVIVHSGFEAPGSDLSAPIEDPSATFLCYVNADRRYLEKLGPLRGFHIVRDPRDIVVSAYYSHLYSHPKYGNLARHRDGLRSVPKDEGLLLEMESRERQFARMLSWDYDRDDVLELHMEDVTSDPQRALPEILAFLELGYDQGLDADTVAALVQSSDFSAIAGRPRGVEDVTSHFRKGVAGDWMEHFTEDHIAYFKAHYNDLLLKLGYESSPDWKPVNSSH